MILPWKMVRTHNNSNIKTWKVPYKPFKLSSDGSYKFSMQSNGENAKCMTVGVFWPKRNTVNSTLRRLSQTNNYWSFIVSGSHSRKGSNKQWASRIHLFRHGKSIWFNTHGIQVDQNEAGIKGIIFNFIQNVLKSRSFEVKVNENLSYTRIQTASTPQGSVVSPKYHAESKQNRSSVQNDNRFHISRWID